MSVFVTSDLHFDHELLCQNLRKMSAKESNELILDNWNKVVNKKDKVFILGDVAMEKPQSILNWVPKLNGIKHIILGNHDTNSCIKALIDCGCKVDAYLKYHDYAFSHKPIHPSLMYEFKLNIHGHIHLDEINNITFDERYFNVNTELHNYTPVSWRQIEEYYETKIRKCI